MPVGYMPSEPISVQYTVCSVNLYPFSILPSELISVDSMCSELMFIE